jgi:hypothetical protein
MNNVFFMHGEADKGNKYTLAAALNGDQLNVGLSICSSKDQFNRKKGRLIAAGRANARPILTQVVNFEDGKESTGVVSIMSELSQLIKSDAKKYMEIIYDTTRSKPEDESLTAEIQSGTMSDEGHSCPSE